MTTTTTYNCVTSNQPTHANIMLHSCNRKLSNHLLAHPSRSLDKISPDDPSVGMDADYSASPPLIHTSPAFVLFVYYSTQLLIPKRPNL